MWQIISEIRRRGTMNSTEISDFSIFTLHRRKKSAGGCVHQAVARGHISIIGHTYLNGKLVNVYI